MQNASKAYKEAMASPLRNRGYIKVSIGVVNSDAQRAVGVDTLNTDLTYFANVYNPFNGHTVDKVYATQELDISKVDGSMYFLPKQESGLAYYNNGIVTDEFSGEIYIDFHTDVGYDIKGLGINWGENYPVDFSIENDAGIHYYSGNSTGNWTTQDVFNGTTYIIIRVTKMLNDYLRTRIFEFTCGIVNIFTNENIISYTGKEFVSPITETVPSQDTTLIVSNLDLYYSADNPDSALAYMEVGQEIKVAFGYDVVGNQNIEDVEWIPEITTYLKTWSSDETQAKFTGTDRFDYLTDKYYEGHYYAQGISLYDLAIDVLADVGITDSREYYLDPYLQKVIVNNPVPVVTHAEALQLIANAGRCALSADRQKRIHIQSSFIPDMAASCNGETDYSNVKNILNDEPKKGYAVCSNDFSIVDNTLYFLTQNKADYFENLGYVSESMWIGQELEVMSNRLSFRLGTDRKYLTKTEGYWDGATPTIIIYLEASFVAHGLVINFRNVAPKEFIVKTYNQNVPVDTFTFMDPELDFITHEMFDSFTRMEIIFTKGYPNSRVFIDNIHVDNVTDYYLRRGIEVLDSPTATRQNRIKSINMERTVYQPSEVGVVNLKSEDIILSAGETEYTVYLSKASYDYAVTVTDSEGNETDVVCEIVKSNNFYAVLKFSNVAANDTEVKFTLQGAEYIVDYIWLVVPHNETGEVKEWSNPLISSISHGRDVEEWLASYFLGDVTYQINWRGDPRVDANDLFYLETKDMGNQLIRGYEHDMKFAGAWSATTKARRAVLEWQ